MTGRRRILLKTGRRRRRLEPTPTGVMNVPVHTHTSDYKDANFYYRFCTVIITTVIIILIHICIYMCIIRAFVYTPPGMVPIRLTCHWTAPYVNCLLYIYNRDIILLYRISRCLFDFIFILCVENQY